MYFVKGRNESGETNTVYLDGDEEYGFVCGKCGKEKSIDADEFFEDIEETGIYGSVWFCSDCTELRMTALERALDKIQEYRGDRYVDIIPFLTDIFEAADKVRDKWFREESKPQREGDAT